MASLLESAWSLRFRSYSLPSEAVCRRGSTAGPLDQPGKGRLLPGERQKRRPAPTRCALTLHGLAKYHSRVRRCRGGPSIND